MELGQIEAMDSDRARRRAPGHTSGAMRSHNRSYESTTPELAVSIDTFQAQWSLLPLVCKTFAANIVDIRAKTVDVVAERLVCWMQSRDSVNSC